MYSDRPVRRKPAHGVYPTFDGPTIVFVTVCAHRKRPWLANPRCHDALVDVWRQARGWLVGRYVIMPDHLHFFAAPGEIDTSLDLWVRYWKRLFAKHKPPGEGWQELHWDTRIRTANHYAERDEYMRQNPIEKGLVALPEDWPFCGEVFDVR